MSKEKKAQIIDALQSEFSNCSFGIMTDYRGLSNAEITELRRKVQASDGTYKVVKNTLARITIAHDFMWRVQAERRRVKQGRRDDKLRKQQERDSKDGGGT